MSEPVCAIPNEARCPNCSAFATDENGLRVAYCANCGRCEHPSTYFDRAGRMVCNACGARVTAGVQVLEHDGEPD